MHDSTLNNCQTCGAPLDPDNPQPLCEQLEAASVAVNRGGKASETLTS